MEDGEGRMEDGEGRIEDGEGMIEDGEGRCAEGEGRCEDGEGRCEEGEGICEGLDDGVISVDAEATIAGGGGGLAAAGGTAADSRGVICWTGVVWWKVGRGGEMVMAGREEWEPMLVVEGGGW